MEVSQRIAVSGMLASQRQLDVVANNLANVNTNGFRRAIAHTTDIGYQAGLNVPFGNGGLDLRVLGVGEGARTADIQHDFLPGPLQATGRSLDVSLQGEGFFQVTLPGGATGYTRDGSFGLDGSGQLVTSGGLPVQSSTGGALLVPAGSTAVRFDEVGNFVATDAGGQEQVIGQLAVAQFPNSGGLQANGQNLWLPSPASGEATTVDPTAPAAPLVVGGALETSNVEVADDFTRLIQAQRSYQMNSKVVQAWDDVQRMANDLRGA
jgi:flagellar basal-body rod protein FlgG